MSSFSPAGADVLDLAVALVWVVDEVGLDWAARLTVDSVIASAAVHTSSHSLRIVFSLSVNATLADRVRDAINRQHVGCDAVVNFVSVGIANDIVERADHDVGQLFVHHRFLPEVALPVL